ncbi:MAG: hypothetical protein ACI8SR_000453 [Oceanicoccus sp.]|jgi:hypothetical protein
MITNLILVFHFIFAIYILYEYMSYLRWPKVKGIITSTLDVTIDKGLVSPKKNHRLLCYEFLFLEKVYKGSQQSRWLPLHFRPRFRIGQNVIISVNRSDPRKSCFYRPIVEFFVTLTIIAIAFISGFIIWWFYIFLV